MFAPPLHPPTITASFNDTIIAISHNHAIPEDNWRFTVLACVPTPHYRQISRFIPLLHPRTIAALFAQAVFVIRSPQLSLDAYSESKHADRWYDSCVAFSMTVLENMKKDMEAGPSAELLRVRYSKSYSCTLLTDKYLQQQLAENVATFHTDKTQDQYMKAVDQILSDGVMQGGRNYIQNYKSQVVTKYALLERLATTLGCAPVDTSLKNRVTLTENIQDRLQSVLKHTVQWHQIGRNMLTHLSNIVHHEEQVFTSPVPATLSDIGHTFCRNIKWLLGAQGSFRTADVAIAEGNLQMMAFMVHWHATVCESCRL